MSLNQHQSPQSAPDWTHFFRDAEGKIVIAQYPNWPLWVWLSATLLENMLVGGVGLSLARITSFAAIAYWAYLEIVSGVNPFTENAWGLGGFVLLFVVYSRLSSQFLS